MYLRSLIPSSISIVLSILVLLSFYFNFFFFIYIHLTNFYPRSFFFILLVSLSFKTIFEQNVHRCNLIILFIIFCFPFRVLLRYSSSCTTQRDIFHEFIFTGSWKFQHGGICRPGNPVHPRRDSPSFALARAKYVIRSSICPWFSRKDVLRRFLEVELRERDKKAVFLTVFRRGTYPWFLFFFSMRIVKYLIIPLFVTLARKNTLASS